MKKIIFGLLVAVSSLSVQAEYLYWSVTSESGFVSTGTSGEWTYARLMWTANEDMTNGNVIDSVLKADAASGVNSDVSTYAGVGYKNYSYYIELVSYENSTATTYYRSQKPFTYSELSGAWNEGNPLQGIAAASMFTGTRVVGTPEPTSGLLLLMGFAMLGLKRKKEV